MSSVEDLVRVQVVAAAGHGDQVVAHGECAAPTGNDGQPDLRVFVDVVEHPPELVAHLDVDGVELVGAVQGDVPHPLLDLVFDLGHFRLQSARLGAASFAAHEADRDLGKIAPPWHGEYSTALWGEQHDSSSHCRTIVIRFGGPQTLS